MTDRLRIAVVGAGSIGCYVGGRLIAADAAEVVLIGRPRMRDELAQHGLILRERTGDTELAPDRVAVATELAAARDADAILVAVKTGHTDAVAAELAAIARPDAIVVSLQNGVRNPDVLRARLPGRQIVAGIVGFNVGARGTGVLQRGTSGPIALARVDDPRARALTAALVAAGLEVETHADLAPHQWTKLLVNLNNAVSALTGAPTREIMLSSALRRIVAAVIGEARGVLRAAGIRPAALRGIPLGLVMAGLRLPTVMVRLVARAQLAVDPEARSSMWDDLTRGRPTEVDDLNGEIVRVAERAGVAAPLNRRLVDLVHAAERAGAGSPGLTAAALGSALTTDF